MNTLNFILLIVAFSLTNSNIAVSGIVLSFTIPAVMFGIIAGAYVDRWNKKRVLLITNVSRFALLLILAFWHSSLFIVYFLTFIVAIITQFFIPAETPIIPRLVPRGLLLSANALFGIALYGSLLVAYALSGSFLLFFGTTNALILLSLIFLVASFWVILIKIPKEEVMQKISGKISILKEVKQSLSLIKKDRDLSHSFLLLAIAQIIIFIIAVIGPGYARQILNIDVKEFPLLFVTPAAIGMAVGAFVLTHYFHDSKKHKIVTVGLFLSGISVLLLPYGSKVASKHFIQNLNLYLPHFLNINILHIVVVLAFILGFANALVFVPSNTLIQEKTSDDLRGKVYGALNTVASFISLLPVILAGSLADIFGVGAILTVVGLLVIIIGVSRLFIDY